MADPEALRRWQQAESTVLRVDGEKLTKLCICGKGYKTTTKRNQAHCSWDCWVMSPARFWKNVDIRGVDDCWHWKARLSHRGYGVYSLRGKNHNAHRVAYWLAVEEPASHLSVCHKCDNPRCCNPNHLFVGTNDDNIRDKMLKGRHRGPRGERAAQHVLKSEDIPVIRALRASGMRLKDIAPMFGVGWKCIQKVAHRMTWRHIA